MFYAFTCALVVDLKSYSCLNIFKSRGFVFSIKKAPLVYVVFGWEKGNNMTTNQHNPNLVAMCRLHMGIVMCRLWHPYYVYATFMLYKFPTLYIHECNPTNVQQNDLNLLSKPYKTTTLNQCICNLKLFAKSVIERNSVSMKTRMFFNVFSFYFFKNNFVCLYHINVPFQHMQAI